MSFSKNEPSKNRAAQLRQSRQQKSTKQAGVGKKPVSQATVHNKYPVVSRSSSNAKPLRQPVNTQPRKKVYYKVGANGVETRLPSIPIVKFSWQWVSGLLTVVCLVSALMATNMDSFKVNNIELQGLQRVTLADLQPIIQSNAQSVFTLDRGKVLDSLAIAFPELKDIQLRVHLPNSVTITAQERLPILAWKTGKNVVWVDAEGLIMPVRGEAGNLVIVKANGKPFISNTPAAVTSLTDIAEAVLEPKTDEPSPKDSLQYLDPRVMNAAVQLSALMPQGSSLVYDPISGMGWRDPGGWRVYFGNELSDIEFKKIEYQAIIDELAKLGIKPTMVSVENVDSPYFRTD